MSAGIRGLAIGVGWLAGSVGGWAALSVGEDFEAGEAVESIVVKVGVGAGGGGLSERVALDLGLGFPLWLYPVGCGADEVPLFGAIPSSGAAVRAVREGESASFSFRAGDDPGTDALRSTGQLLAGVRVSDISRIGFASRGSNDWELAEYDIQINGKPFAKNAGIGARAGERQGAARARMAALDPQVAPLQAEADELAALIEIGLAADGDRQRAAEVQGRLSPLVRERESLRRQLAGGHPWFIEPGFRSPWRTGDEIRGMKVTLATAAHTGADTRNYVYFCAGGHKYLVGSPANPLEPGAGPREIAIDLLAGPLVAADLRGYALGMLGHGAPEGDAPDRWHPQRLIVEVDGRVVYDSEENDIDRMSLEAIRVIPPAHWDAAGKVVENVPGPRETHVWEAGKGMGLDLVNGGALGLPPEGEPGYPAAEGGWVGDLPFQEEGMGGGWGGFDDDFPPFPGEGGFGPGWGGGWWDDPGGGGWGPGWGGGFGPGWMDVLVGVLGGLAPLLPGLDPPPVGEPFQVTSVRMTPPADPSGNFSIQWDVTGDAGSIQDFTVLILPVRPDEPNPIDFAAPLAEINGVGAGTRDLGTALSHLPPAADRPYLYLIPVVIAHATDEAVDAGVGDHTGLGLALPYVFSATDPDQMQVMFAVDGAGVAFPVSAGDPGGAGPAVWYAGEVASHRIGLLFGNTMPGQNIVIRPGAGAPLDHVYLVLWSPPVEGRYLCHFHLGFEGEAGGPNAADGDMIGVLAGAGPDHRYYPGPPYLIPNPWPQPLTHVVSTPAGDEVMPIVSIQEPPGTDRVVDTAADGGAGAWNLCAAICITGAAVDPDHPCVLFGLRLVEVP